MKDAPAHMDIKVRHSTTYTYEHAGSSLVQRLRLTPPDLPSQKVVDWTIEAPGIEGALRYVDGFGNITHLLTPHGGMTEVTVVATGHVITTDSAGILGQDTCHVPVNAFLTETPITRANSTIRALARDYGKLDGVQQIHALSAGILEKVSYAVGTTTENTTASQAMINGTGVCQDHAHIFISAARLLGLPARYVSGYMIVGENEHAEASHAWAEVYLHGLGWVGFDVSNQISPDERYVRVSTGIDVVGATPIKGVRRGFHSGSENMSVQVLVEQVSAQ